MLEIVIPKTELFDEQTNEFIYTKEQKLQLEHSLVSLSKWEQRWCIPFLTNKEKTDEQNLDYVKCMTVTQNVDPSCYLCLTPENLKDISDYIKAPMTATTITQEKDKVTNREVVTAELIYYWMVALVIPFECKKWHLNTLLTLINVCNIKNQPRKKMSKSDIYARNRALNAARLAELKTTG